MYGEHKTFIFALHKQVFQMEQLQIIPNKIYETRGQRMMLDRDLAEMHGVPQDTKSVSQA